jgi:hypothetical protein
MKKLLIIFVCLSLFACKSKKIDRTKEKEKSRIESVSRLDSLVRINLQLIEELKTESLLEKTRFELRTITDSTGMVQPLEYKHVKNGKVVEEITLKGGSLLHDKDTQKETFQQEKTIKKDEKIEIKSAAKHTENREVKTKKQQAEITATGGTFGGYLSWIIFLLVLAVLAFVSWRLKLF